MDSHVPLMKHDPSDVGSLIKDPNKVEKRKRQQKFVRHTEFMNDD